MAQPVRLYCDLRRKIRGFLRPGFISAICDKPPKHPSPCSNVFYGEEFVAVIWARVWHGVAFEALLLSLLRRQFRVHQPEGHKNESDKDEVSAGEQCSSVPIQLVYYFGAGFWFEI